RDARSHASTRSRTRWTRSCGTTWRSTSRLSRSDRRPVSIRLARLACLVASGALAGRAGAQTIAPADFLPLGAGAQWLYQRATGSGRSDLRLDVIDVNQASTGTRYVLEVPFEGFTSQVRLEIANDGSLLLRAFEAQLNDILEDVPFDPEATADVQF